MPKKHHTPQDDHLLMQWENSSDFSSPVTAVEIAQLLGLSVSSRLMRELAEAEFEPSHSENGWRR